MVCLRRFEGKNVLVTGAASGIGKAISEAFASEGAYVVCTDINRGALDDMVAVIVKSGGRAEGQVMDVTRAGHVNEVINGVVASLGRIDVLANNAGVSSMASVLDLTEEEWDFNMNVNAKGVFLCSKAALPAMIAQGGGKIVNTASMASKIGAPFLAHYSASKFAVLGFTQAFAREAAQYNINVNAVCPGFVATSMQDREVVWEGKLRGMSSEEVRADYIRQTPLGRLCQPEDVARVVLFLASDDADFMTGQGINVTGGTCSH
ncbi:MAG: SDR family NAD(P)-dependent oxidoreductase [Clostridia bacterium]|nr:SDR family NAD(P)-dependent oxidoreductase [Clostridia bacterium]